MSELNKKQIAFELDEDEIEMLIQLIDLEQAKRGKVTRSDFGGEMIRTFHRKEFPQMWDDLYYKPRLQKITA